jgi:hypothetical protein
MSKLRPRTASDAEPATMTIADIRNHHRFLRMKSKWVWP